MKQKLVSMIGVLIVMISTVFLMSGCPDGNRGNIPSGGSSTTTNTSIKGLWRIDTTDGSTFPIEQSASEQNYLYIAGGQFLYLTKISGSGSNTGLFKNKDMSGTCTIESYNNGNYRLVITTYGKGVIGSSCRISGNTLIIGSSQLRATKVNEFTEEEILNAPYMPNTPSTPDPDPTPQPNPAETLKEGVYIGIISFDENMHELTKVPVLLDYSGKEQLTNLLNTKYSRAEESGTLLYYSVHKAFSTLRGMESKLPEKTKFCNIITFTDGLDVGSLSPIIWNSEALDGQNFGGKTGDEYLQWLSSQLETTKIKGQLVTASAYGVAGSDVSPSDMETFKSNLKKLTTTTGECNTSITFDELKQKFGEIAQSLNVVTINTSFNLLITPPSTGNGTVYKMTFDNIGTASSDADNSNVYFTGEYNYADGKYTLSNIEYKGIQCYDTSITGTVEGKKVQFHFDTFKLENGKIEDAKIQQWFKGPSATAWQRNSEYDQSNTTTSTTDKSSAVIYLVLDSSKSLTESNVTSIRNAAINFIDVLYEKYNKTN